MTTPTELKSAGREFFVAILSVLSIVNVVLLYAVRDGALDTVLVAGKGHETGQEVAGRVHPFDDREELRAAIEEVRR